MNEEINEKSKVKPLTEEEIWNKILEDKEHCYLVCTNKTLEKGLDDLKYGHSYSVFKVNKELKKLEVLK